jgi:hypothetical protein
MIRVVLLIVPVVLIIVWVAAAMTEVSDRATRATKGDVDRARKEGRLPPKP